MKAPFNKTIALITLFSLFFFQLKASNTPIQYGETIKDSIEVEGDIDTFSFIGNAGDEIVINFIAENFSFDTKLVLKSPSGEILKDSINGKNRSRLSMKLSTSGMHTILVSESSDNASSSYGISLINLELNAIKIDVDSVHDEISDLKFSEIKAYQIDLKANENIILSYQAHSFFPARIEIYQPDGSLFWSKSYLNLILTVREHLFIPISGSYTVLVMDWHRANGETTQSDEKLFSLSFQKKYNPLNTKLIELDSVYKGNTVLKSTEINFYQTNLTAGEEFIFRIDNSIVSSFSPRVDVYQPDGTVLWSNSSLYSFRKDFLTSLSGNYSIFIIDRYGACIDPKANPLYTFSIHKKYNNVNQINIIKDTVINTNLSKTTEIDFYQFEAQPLDSVFLSIIKNTSSFLTHRLELYSPSGELIIEENSRNTIVLNNPILPEAGKYTLLVMEKEGDNTGDYSLNFQTIKSQKIPMKVWIPFETQEGFLYRGLVDIPTTDNLFVLLKKATRIGYANTWKGEINLFKDDLEIHKEDNDENIYGGSSSDIDVHLKNPIAGNYAIDILATDEAGEGFYMVTDILPQLTLDEWTTGEILRPYGYDWKQVDIPSGVDTFYIHTEGFGKWSTIEVFYEHIDDETPNWRFDNWGKGYFIDGKIANPTAGRYYIRYKDSAVLQNDDSGNLYTDQEDQKREYLIIASTSLVQDMEEIDLMVTGTSVDTVGQGIASFKVYGANFTESDSLYLTRNSETLSPTSQFLNEDKNEWTINFDLSEANIGNWSISVKNESGAKTSPELLYIEAYEGSDVWASVLARPQVRAGRWQKIILEIGNTGNTDAFGVPVGIRISPIADFRFADSLDKVPSFVEESMTPEDLEAFETYFDSDWKNVPNYADSINVNSGKEHRSIPIILFRIPAKSSITLEMEVQFLTTGDFELNVLAHSPLVDGGDFANRSNARWCIGDECFLTSAQAFLDIIIGDNFSNAKQCAVGLYEKLKSLIFFGVENYKDEKNAPVGMFITSFALGSVNTAISCAKAAGAIIPASLTLKILSRVGDIFTTIQLVKDCIRLHPEDCNSVLSQAASYFDALITYQGRIIGSTTPEDKFGIIGVEQSEDTQLAERKNFIHEKDEFAYRIDYWNKANASAPAVEVFIRDTLDENFDPLTFEFTEIGFLRWKETKEIKGQYFNVMIDMRPDFNLIVNVEGNFNPNTREIYWVHRALDPETLELPDDPTLGFLPPVDPDRYNLGFVKFRIAPKSGLPTGTVFKNRAHVNFDGIGPWGKAPPYGPWVNTYDFDAPISAIQVPSQCEDLIQLEIIGNDGAGAGIDRYTIYASENGATFERIMDTTTTIFTYQGNVGSTYSFFSIATDKVGNREPFKTVADPHASITVAENGTPCSSCDVSISSPHQNAVMDNNCFNGADNIDWFFSWTECPDATKYQLFVKGVGESGALIDESNLKQPFFHFYTEDFSSPLPSELLVEVRALVDGIWGHFSPEVTFTLEQQNTDCDETCIESFLILDEKPIVANNTYRAINSITSKGEVRTGTKITFIAGQDITLLPEFHAQAGSDFHALIGPCNPPFLREEESIANSRAIELNKNSEEGSLKIKVVPNPIHNDATVHFYLPTSKKAVIQIFDFYGRLVHNSQYQTELSGWYNTSFTTSQLVGGMYFVHLQTKEESIVEKVIVVK